VRQDLEAKQVLPGLRLAAWAAYPQVELVGQQDRMLVGPQAAQERRSPVPEGLLLRAPPARLERCWAALAAYPAAALQVVLELRLQPADPAQVDSAPADPVLVERRLAGRVVLLAKAVPVESPELEARRTPEPEAKRLREPAGCRWQVPVVRRAAECRA
jgi:hypothetical protein